MSPNWSPLVGAKKTLGLLRELRREISMAITIKGRESLQISEGKHQAKIHELKVEKRGKEQYEYFDVYVEVLDVDKKDGTHPVIKMGMPFDLSVNTKMGSLLKAFGVSEDDIKGGEDIDIEKVLPKGKKVQIITKDSETDKGTFAEIISMKPA
jgi:hypothetical protein